MNNCVRNQVAVSTCGSSVCVLILLAGLGSALAAESTHGSPAVSEPTEIVTAMEKYTFDAALAEYVLERPDGLTMVMTVTHEGQMICEERESDSGGESRIVFQGQIPDERLHAIRLEVERLGRLQVREVVKVSEVGVMKSEGLEYLKYLIVCASDDVEYAIRNGADSAKSKE